MDELLDLVDQQDKIIGQKLRSEIYDKKLTNFRVVNAFIQNDDGDLWIPRRSKDKRVFPLCLDASMGGHVAAGETYEEAFNRELMEELRIDSTKVFFQEFGVLTPHQHGVSAFMKVFLLQSNQEPNYNTDDFIESFWYSPKKLLFLLQSGDISKGDLPKIIQHLFINDIQ